jgi:hypothetical protein
MFGTAHGAMRPPHSFVGLNLRGRYRVPLSMSGERSTTAMLMDHIPRCSWYIIHLHDRVVHVLEEFRLKAGATKGRGLRLEVRRIRS